MISKVWISKAGYGLAGFVLLAATAGLDGQQVFAQPASLQDVPLPAAPTISPWPKSTPDSSAPESSDPQSQEATEQPATENRTTATTEDADIASLDIDWSQLDVDASTLMMTNPAKLHLAPRITSSGDMIWSSQEKAYG